MCGCAYFEATFQTTALTEGEKQTDEQSPAAQAASNLGDRNNTTSERVKEQEKQRSKLCCSLSPDASCMTRWRDAMQQRAMLQRSFGGSSHHRLPHEPPSSSVVCWRCCCCWHHLRNLAQQIGRSGCCHGRCTCSCGLLLMSVTTTTNKQAGTTTQRPTGETATKKRRRPKTRSNQQ